MNLLGNLGIDIWLLGAQIINFILLLWVLKRFIYTPLIKRIEEDERMILRAQTEEEKLEKRTKALERKEKQITTRARNKAESIIRGAEEIAEDIKKKASAESAAEKEAVIAQVRERLNEMDEHDQV